MKSIDKLNRKIKLLGISKSHVARLIGCSRPHLYRILRGERYLTDAQKKSLQDNQLI